MRSFIAVDIPNEIKKKLISLEKEIPSFEGKFTSPENLHLTLKFLGEIDKNTLKKVEENLSKVKFKKFSAEIDSLGIFNNSKSKRLPRKIILWASLTNCDGLQEKIDSVLSDVFAEERRFMGHITIARIKRLDNEEMFLKTIRSIKPKEMKFEVSSFVLKKSVLSQNGPSYENIKTYLLA